MTTPLAYFVTFRTYGTWLPGNARGSSTPGRAQYGAPVAFSDPLRSRDAAERMCAPPWTLTRHQRVLIDATVTAVCAHRHWILHAVNARSTHVHVVVAAPAAAAKVLGDLKAWCTRRLREQGGLAATQPAWARSGSVRYLFSPDVVHRVCDYVRYAQDRAR